MEKTMLILVLILFFITNLEAKKYRTDKEIEEDYKKRLKPFEIELIKRKNYFPDGITTEASVSKCYKIGIEQDSLSLPPEANVKMLNIFDIFIKKKPVKYWQIIYKNKIYCIPNDNIKPKEKIIVMEGRGRSEIEGFARYILLQNGIYIEVLESIGPMGGGYPAPVHPVIKGEYTRTENTITLCMTEKWSQLSEYREKKIKNKECTVLEKYTDQIPDYNNKLKGNWINPKRLELVIEELIFE
ncbi:MAG: hypothetical protein OEZ22_02665 [Spirochaetia bacterium]|nr:hypothetical protein [Spirochaetia bacterium]